VAITSRGRSRTACGCVPSRPAPPGFVPEDPALRSVFISPRHPILNLQSIERLPRARRAAPQPAGRLPSPRGGSPARRATERSAARERRERCASVIEPVGRQNRAPRGGGWKNVWTAVQVDIDTRHASARTCRILPPSGLDILCAPVPALPRRATFCRPAGWGAARRAGESGCRVTGG
jgi:hypothetical protein